MSTTFQEAQAASLYTGSSIVPDMDPMESQYTETPTEKFIAATRKVITKKFSSGVLVENISTTLLRNSEMFGLVGSVLEDINSFVEFIQIQDFDSVSPRDVVASLSGYMSIDEYAEVVRFFARNKDIAPIVKQVVSKTAKHPNFASGEISVFSEPSDSDYSISINADFAMDDYDEAYQVERAIFEETIAPFFDLVNHRIMLSFDTDEDD